MRERRASFAEIRLPEGPAGQTIEGPNALAVLSRPTANVLNLMMRGRICAEHADRIVIAFEQALCAGDPVHLFADMGDLEDYHSTLRIKVVEVFKRRRSSVLTVHAFSKSRIVSMGIAVVNLAIGGIIVHHTTRAAFEAARKSHDDASTR
jgi:hypothetical protein